ncbi:MAG: MFS transporter [Rhodospirillales bacterium]|nr:MFS transporter [Rhodospirillales bacterium]
MDLSSEMIHGLLPLFMATTLGASMVTIGIVEGIAEAIASLLKIVSGTLSDWVGRRKALTIAGYGLAALAKPLFALATGMGLVMTARFADRIGKGIRGAPRDALIGAHAPPHLRGACFGLRQSLDTVGAFLGPLAALFLLWVFAGDLRAVFWVAVVPAFLSVAVLIAGVRDPPSPSRPTTGFPLRRDRMAELDRRFWILLALTALFHFARPPEAFLILRATDAGLAAILAPVVLVIMNVVYALAAYPAGGWSDRIGRPGVMAVSLVPLLLAQAILALAAGWETVLAGVALWGLHMGLSQGVLAALVVDASPERLRGTAFGLFHLVSGCGLVAAGLLGGFLWDRWSPTAAYGAGAGLTLVLFLALALSQTKRPG